MPDLEDHSKAAQAAQLSAVEVADVDNNMQNERARGITIRLRSSVQAENPFATHTTLHSPKVQRHRPESSAPAAAAAVAAASASAPVESSRLGETLGGAGHAAGIKDAEPITADQIDTRLERIDDLSQTPGSFADSASSSPVGRLFSTAAQEAIDRLVAVKGDRHTQQVHDASTVGLVDGSLVTNERAWP